MDCVQCNVRYRHQFGHCMLNYAKLQSNKDLGPNQIALNFPCLS